MPIRDGQIVNERRPLFQFLTQAGDGTGAINANGNYSGGATTWFIQPPLGQIFEIWSLLIYNGIGTDNMQIKGWGNNTTPLTNGLNFSVRINNVVSTAPGVNPIKSYDTLQSVCTDFDMTFDVATPNQWGYIRASIDFGRQWGMPLVLSGNELDRFSITLNDNFTTRSMDRQTFSIFGRNSP